MSTERKTPKASRKRKAKTHTPDPSKPCANPRQEAYAQLCIDPEVTQYEAYLKVYPHSAKWKRASVDQAASKLKAKIAPRIEWLKTQVAEKATGTLAEADTILWEMIQTTYADHMAVLPDGEQIIELTKDSPRKYAIQSLKQRIEVTKAEEGNEQIARVLEYKLHDRRALLDQFYKRRGAYPPQKMQIGADDNLAKFLMSVVDENDGLSLNND